MTWEVKKNGVSFIKRLNFLKTRRLQTEDRLSTNTVSQKKRKPWMESQTMCIISKVLQILRFLFVRLTL